MIRSIKSSVFILFKIGQVITGFLTIAMSKYKIINKFTEIFILGNVS